ncbi:hypothetical protein [Alkalimarinus coralli]|uniref:hypothetical protein n=1 Tax=Alkalimarinus coralli TaxID=2935863 RepID=UPI00202B9364|nr:hypothetical protein [Alkalimarinus coralli]
MTYVLEPISLEDQNKIIDDAISDPEKLSLLSFLRKEGQFSKNWAINKKVGNYLFLVPEIVRTDTMYSRFFVLIDGSWFEVYVDSLFGNKAAIKGGANLVAELRGEIEEELMQAFVVYGRFGKGPLNEFGKPEFEIIPEFNWEV